MIDKAKLFKTAWEIAKQAAEQFNDSAKNFFSEALKQAWNKMKNKKEVVEKTYITATNQAGTHTVECAVEILEDGEVVTEHLVRPIFYNEKVVYSMVVTKENMNKLFGIKIDSAHVDVILDDGAEWQSILSDAKKISGRRLQFESEKARLQIADQDSTEKEIRSAKKHILKCERLGINPNMIITAQMSIA